MDSKKHLSIGLFDSGVGGLTVMQSVKQALPGESLIYFGDTARIPYGDKSRDTIIRYSIENSIFLMEQNIKMLIVACNTASAYALDKLRKIFNLPVIGTIEPGAQKAAHVTRNQRIAVLGTKGTINSGMYQKAILRLLPEAEIVAVACPLFVPLIEEKFIYSPAVRLIVQEYLKPLRDQNIDTILLGCTHYPLIKTLIQEEVGSDVVIVDSASTCAEWVAALLEKYCLHNISGEQAVYSYFVSDDPHKFQHVGADFLGGPIGHVECVQTFNCHI